MLVDSAAAAATAAAAAATFNDHTVYDARYTIYDIICRRTVGRGMVNSVCKKLNE